MLSENDKKKNTESHSQLSPEGGLTFIEQLQISSNKPCTKLNVPYIVGVNENAKVCVLSKTTCKQWNCETCSFRNAARWIAKIINGVNRLGGSWYFLTITANENWRGNKSITNIRQGWKKLYNRILALQGKKSLHIYYAKVWEQHKDGTFHLHLLINLKISSRWLKNNARSCGMGYSAKAIEVDNAGQVAGYIAKYSLKNASISRGGIAWPKGLRRIETSQKWPELDRTKKAEGLEWIIKFSRDEQLASANRYHLRGFDILDFGE